MSRQREAILKNAPWHSIATLQKKVADCFSPRSIAFSELKLQHSCAWSKRSFQVGAHYFFDPADFCVPENFTKVKLLAYLIKLQGFQYDVHTELVSKLKAVSQCLLLLADESLRMDRNTIQYVYLLVKLSTSCG